MGKGDEHSSDSKKDLPPPGWKRNPTLLNLKKVDEVVSNKFFLAVDAASPLGKYMQKLKLLELSAHTLASFGACVFFWWFSIDKDNKAFFTNTIFAFFVDVIMVAIVKAIARRRRPGMTREQYERDPSTTNLSFPSGFASRATLFAMILFYKTSVFPLVHILFLAWAFAVAGAKILLARQFLGDMVGGVLLGFLQYALVFSWVWLDAEDIVALEAFFAG